MKMEILCTLVREQAASQVTFEHFDGNPLSFAYFLSMSTESVEKKIEEPMGRLPRLIKCTTGEVQEKHFIIDKPEEGYRNSVELLRRQYENPHGRDSMKILMGYWLHIEWKSNTCHQLNQGIYQHLESCLISCSNVNL